MFLDSLFEFRMIAPQLWSKFCNFPDGALSELAAATNEHRFYTQNTFPKKILAVSRHKGILKKSWLLVGTKGEL